MVRDVRRVARRTTRSVTMVIDPGDLMSGSHCISRGTPVPGQEPGTSFECLNAPSCVPADCQQQSIPHDTGIQTHPIDTPCTVSTLPSSGPIGGQAGLFARENRQCQQPVYRQTGNTLADRIRMYEGNGRQEVTPDRREEQQQDRTFRFRDLMVAFQSIDARNVDAPPSEILKKFRHSDDSAAGERKQNEKREDGRKQTNEAFSFPSIQNNPFVTRDPNSSLRNTDKQNRRGAFRRPSLGPPPDDRA